jgi:hypothetical protein
VRVADVDAVDVVARHRLDYFANRRVAQHVHDLKEKQRKTVEAISGHPIGGSAKLTQSP